MPHKIYVDTADSTTVVQEFTDDLGHVEVRRYVKRGTEVYEGDTVICECLYRHGTPLHLGSCEPLVDVIRRESRKADKRFKRKLARVLKEERL